MAGREYEHQKDRDFLGIDRRSAKLESSVVTDGGEAPMVPYIKGQLVSQ